MTFTLEWYDSLTDIQCQQIKEIISSADHCDHVMPVGEQVIIGLSSKEGKHLLAYLPGGEVVGYLNLCPDKQNDSVIAECVVDPGHRCRGIGLALGQEAIARADANIKFWAHATLPAAQSLANCLAMQPIRQLLQMRRSLCDLPETITHPVIPSLVRIRHYRGSTDNAEFLRVNNAAFWWHPEQGGWTMEDLEARFNVPWFEPAGLFLAEDFQGKLQGFHWTKVHPDKAGVGEVYVLGIDPVAQGQGLGKVLTAVGISSLAQRLAHFQDPEVILYVESDNAPALATYRQLGFVTCSVDTAYSSM